MERDFPKGSASPPRKADDDSCRSLLDQIAQGSESALAEFYRLYEAPVYAFAQIRLNDFHDAADLLNEVMWEVWRGAGSLLGGSASPHLNVCEIKLFPASVVTLNEKQENEKQEIVAEVERHLSVLEELSAEVD